MSNLALLKDTTIVSHISARGLNRGGGGRLPSNEGACQVMRQWVWSHARAICTIIYTHNKH